MAGEKHRGGTPPPKVIVQRTTLRHFVWPEDLARLLGQVSDQFLAAKAGLNLQSVRAERRRRGIEPFRPRPRRLLWTKKRIALLGTDSDRKVAAQLGFSRAAVKSKRRVLSIPPFFPPPHDRNPGHLWRSEEIALLGKASDRQVAELVGLATSSVTKYRQILGITASQPAWQTIRWTPKMLALLGQVSDAKLAQRFRVSTASVLAKRSALRIPAHRATGPILSTPELVELLGLPTAVVRRSTWLRADRIGMLRRKHGIELRSPSWRWTPKVIRRLGAEPDSRIAHELGITADSVGAKRRRLGIPALRPTRPWQPHEVAALGTAPHKIVAARLGRSVPAVKTKRWELSQRARAARRAR